MLNFLKNLFKKAKDIDKQDIIEFGNDVKNLAGTVKNVIEEIKDLKEDI